MSPPNPQNPSDAGELPDTGGLDPAVPPERHRHSSWPPQPALAPPPPAPERRTLEGITAVLALGLTLLGLLAAGAMWVSTVAHDVAELERYRVEHTAEVKQVRESTEARFRTIETTAQSDRAASDKRESLLERSLQDIGDRLDAIQRGVDQLQHHH